MLAAGGSVEILHRKGARNIVHVWCICYCKTRRLVNPSIYNSEVVKVRKMLVNASISGLYQTIAVNDSIYQHQLVKARFV
jgi:hypothetical protein